MLYIGSVNDLVRQCNSGAIKHNGKSIEMRNKVIKDSQ